MKRKARVMISLLIALIAALWSTSAIADQVGSADARLIQAVVESQLNALAEDDAVSAFTLTSPSTRVQLRTADNFLRIIKEQYMPIYRNRNAIFSSAEMIDGQTIQSVRITDDNNHVWVAIYRMERDEDGSWKIDGCRLLQTTSISI